MLHGHGVSQPVRAVMWALMNKGVAYDFQVFNFFILFFFYFSFLFCFVCFCFELLIKFDFRNGTLSLGRLENQSSLP